ncbi:MAG: TRAP transporter permease [Pseudomonadota bacterium]
MTDQDKREERQFSDEELQDLVASTDSGARAPANRSIALLIAGLALVWSLFQLWIAQPMLWFGEWFSVMNSSQTRPLHLFFAIVLAFLAYPAFKSSPRDRIPVTDWILMAIGGFCTFYIFWFADQLALTARSGLPTQTQVIIGAVGILILLEASRRALGPALTVVGSIFLLYAYMGTGWLIPDLIEHEGLSFTALINAQWLDTGGVFGIPLGVSTAFVFLFVLFGSLLDKAGAGNYFIKLAFAGLGHLRGGPAKAAVVGSAMTGLISGSSIANVVTTGTFTIPLMKRVGFTNEQAGSVEVASSVNGQIMPPVMGAAAFLMVEFIGISYVEVIKHAFIPAVISYIALVYIVHLEALKKDMPALGEAKSFAGMIGKFILGFVVAGIAFTALIYGVDALRTAVPSLTGPIMMAVLAAVYIWLVAIASRKPDLEVDDPNAEKIELPEVKDIYSTGLHYVLPIVVLVWFLMVERQSPARSAFFATALMIGIIATQRPLKALFRGQAAQIASEFVEGLVDLREGLIAGARNMIGIGVATAAAGIIVATVTRTPIGTELAGLVEQLSGGILFAMLVLIGLFSLILGMGLPTTANYIVVSSLMASVVVSLGAQEGLIVPLIAAHLFVFYFGIMADVTPPVGLASFAAAAVSGGDPIKTGFTAFFYSLRTVALPFLFIFNPTLILYGVDLGTGAGIAQAAFVFVVATFAMLLFAAATQGYFLAKSRIYESAALLLVAFTLFVPNVWLDMVQDPFRTVDAVQFETVLGEVAEGEQLRLLISGPDFNTGEATETTLVVDATGASAAERLANTGLLLLPEGDVMRLDEPMFGTDTAEALIDFDFYADDPVALASVQIAQDRLPEQVFYIPALLLLGLVIALQRRRQTKPAF